jgi:hypothetical protein
VAAISIFTIVWVAYILIGDIGTTGEFELTVGKGEAVTIVVDQF